MKMTPVKSSQIESVGHDETTSTLYIQFKSGGKYSYAGVSAETFQNFLHAESLGKYFGSEIKGRYPFTKIN